MLVGVIAADFPGRIRGWIQLDGPDQTQSVRVSIPELQIQAAFHPDAAQRTLRLEDGLFGVERSASDGGQRLLALFNFTDQERRVAATALANDLAGWTERIGATPVTIDKGELVLPPYAAFWFSDTRL